LGPFPLQWTIDDLDKLVFTVQKNGVCLILMLAAAREVLFSATASAKSAGVSLGDFVGTAGWFGKDLLWPFFYPAVGSPNTITISWYITKYKLIAPPNPA
jgi:hypothetical protein